MHDLRILKILTILHKDPRYRLAPNYMILIPSDTRKIADLDRPFVHRTSDLSRHLVLAGQLLLHILGIDRIMIAAKSLTASSGKICFLQHS